MNGQTVEAEKILMFIFLLSTTHFLTLQLHLKLEFNYIKVKNTITDYKNKIKTIVRKNKSKAQKLGKLSTKIQ